MPYQKSISIVACFVFRSAALPGGGDAQVPIFTAASILAMPVPSTAVCFSPNNLLVGTPVDVTAALGLRRLRRFVLAFLLASVVVADVGPTSSALMVANSELLNSPG